MNDPPQDPNNNDHKNKNGYQNDVARKQQPQEESEEQIDSEDSEEDEEPSTEDEEEYCDSIQQQLDESLIESKSSNSSLGAFYSENEVKHSPRAAQFFIAGRGGETNHHVGNHQIRTLIMKHLPDYQISPHRGKRFCRQLLADAPNNEFANIKFVVRKSYFDKHRGGRGRNESEEEAEGRTPSPQDLPPKTQGRRKSAQGQLSQDRIDSVLSMHSQSTLDALPDDVFLEIGPKWTVGIVQDLLRGGMAALHKSASSASKTPQSSDSTDSPRATSSASMFSSSLGNFTAAQSTQVVPESDAAQVPSDSEPPPPPWQEFVRHASDSIISGRSGALIDALAPGKTLKQTEGNDAEQSNLPLNHSITSEYILVVPAANAPRQTVDPARLSPSRSKRRRSSSSKKTRSASPPKMSHKRESSI